MATKTRAKSMGRKAQRKAKPRSGVARKKSSVSVKSKTSATSRRSAAGREAAAPRNMTPKDRVEAMERKILKDKKKLVELRREVPLQEVQDYVLCAHDGSEIRLSEMFGSHRDLILVHNMGKGCAYCTLWADGFTGLTKHLENRAGFVVVSKDEVNIQREFYQSRGWNFKMYSSHGTTFNRDMGFETEAGKQQPGVSAFHKDEAGTIHRTGYTSFGPGDDFCAVWPMLDLLQEGAAGWSPKYVY
jgi:predicted dithiol-disulfide oxidoreductase (DUF899 family)